MYYLRNDKTGEYVANIVKLRQSNAYTVYFRKDEPGNARWASEAGARAALDRLLDCEYTNPRGVALDLSVIDPEKNNEEVAHMNEIAAAQDVSPARSLLEIEADIRHQKNVIGEGYVKIGLALIEAKEQLTHGEWGEWLRDRVNFSQSSAEGYMRVAREYGNGSSLLNLPYTKVLALLAVPAEERESFVEANNVEDKSVSEIKQLIRERDEARESSRKWMHSAEQNAHEATEACRRAERAEEQIKAERRDQERLTVMLNKEREKVSELMAREPDTVTIEKEVVPADYDRIKRDLEQYKGRADEAEKEAEEAIYERDRAIKELEEEKASTNQDPLDVAPFCDACSALMNKLYSAPYAGDFFRTRTDAELERYSLNVHLVMDWAVKTQDAIEAILRERRGGDGFVFEL